MLETTLEKAKITEPPISLAEKRQEIRRVLKRIGPSPQLLGPRLLRWLYRQFLENINAKPTVEAISKGCFDAADRQPVQVRNALTAAKTWLDGYYNEPENRSFIEVRPGNPPKTGRKPSFYLLEYKRRRKLPGALSVRTFSRDYVVDVWQKLVFAQPVIQISLVFDTFKGPASQGTDNFDQCAGSGEVAAACLLTQYLAHLKPPVDVLPKRWRDMPPELLSPKRQCIIILGAAVNNGNYDHLRKRKEWKKQQHYHFVAPDEDKGETHSWICKGKSDNGARKGFGFRYNDPPESDYALISFFRDTANTGTLVALQGLTSVSTWAAARFMCEQDTIEQLVGRLKKQRRLKTEVVDQRWPSFEAVISVSGSKDGAPGHVSLKTVLPYGEETFRKPVRKKPS